ncbi:hypothetical protein FB561_0820 [Kribbella amoyensis]|uniref:Uncharacterized protein n=1 Tax=Kribbella amoyensis TaxID=996641 RepID=A0A561BLM8_9ACTN|nr:hypothetical protein [Kribbella amoyensis]TWD79755.1 hypothetical protein FB561_0820 [Kribbella amoyensis]
MSPQEQTTAQPGERATDLAEKTLNAVASVRTRLGRAVAAAEESDGRLWEAEKALVELPALPTAAETDRSAAGSEASPPQMDRQTYSHAQYQAGIIHSALADAQRGVDTLREELTSGAAALDQATTYLDQLEKLPGDGSAQPTAGLRERLAGLEAAIEVAGRGAERTTQRLDAARTSIQPLVYEVGEVNYWGPGQAGARAGRAASIRQTLPGIQAGVGTISAAHVQADRSTADAIELANAVRAASNPTPRTGQAASGTTSEEVRRDRSQGTGRAQGRDL